MRAVRAKKSGSVTHAETAGMDSAYVLQPGAIRCNLLSAGYVRPFPPRPDFRAFAPEFAIPPDLLQEPVKLCFPVFRRVFLLATAIGPPL